MELNTGTTKSKREEIRREERDLSFLGDWLGANNRVFAVLDACDEPLIPSKVLSLGNLAVSLYRGSAEEDFFSIAPYVVEVDQNLIDWIQEHLSSTAWGYFALADASCDLSLARKHFRRFLTVKLPDERKVLFRFYDPRVIATYFESADVEELRAFFGPFRFFGLASPDLEKVVLIERLF